MFLPLMIPFSKFTVMMFPKFVESTAVWCAHETPHATLMG
jgi:hypothetical protein